jgi:LPXTG-motif cell wall-anchored protein
MLQPRTGRFGAQACFIIAGGDGVVKGAHSVTLSSDLTGRQSRASVKADCNNVQWTYTMEGDMLAFNTLGPSTLAFCGDESLAQLFLAKLGMGGAFAVEGDQLVLILNENAGTMTFNNGGAVDAPPTLPETGGTGIVAPRAIVLVAGVGVLGAGLALRRRKQ